MVNGGSSDGSWAFVLVCCLGFVVAVTLAIMGISRANPRLAAWLAAIGPRRLFAMAGAFYCEVALVFLAFRVEETSDRLSYVIIAVVVGAMMAFVLRRMLREVRAEMEEAESGTKP